MLFLCESPTAKGHSRKTGPSWQENGIRESLRFGFVAKITNFKSFRPSFLFLFIFLIRQGSDAERLIGRRERLRARGKRRITGRATDFDAPRGNARISPNLCLSPKLAGAIPSLPRSPFDQRLPRRSEGCCPHPSAPAVATPPYSVLWIPLPLAPTPPHSACSSA